MSHLHKHNKTRMGRLHISLFPHTQDYQFIKNINFNIAFRTNNTIYNQLRDRMPLNKIKQNKM